MHRRFPQEGQYVLPTSLSNDANNTTSHDIKSRLSLCKHNLHWLERKCLLCWSGDNTYPSFRGDQHDPREALIILPSTRAELPPGSPVPKTAQPLVLL